MEKTNRQFQSLIGKCKSLFLKKARDYGISWTVLRMPSVTDQIYIKALRIRSLQEKPENKVGESQESEFMGIINYAVIALMLWENYEHQQPLPQSEEALSVRYDEMADRAFETMQRKNHDYGEAWRFMRVSSITDLILMKIHRLKQIEDNKGKTLVSEGVDANYIDMLNYAVFALILLEESKQEPQTDSPSS